MIIQTLSKKYFKMYNLKFFTSREMFFSHTICTGTWKFLLHYLDETFFGNIFSGIYSPKLVAYAIKLVLYFRMKSIKLSLVAKDKQNVRDSV